jgi:hypothetical protein
MPDEGKTTSLWPDNSAAALHAYYLSDIGKIILKMI